MSRLRIRTLKPELWADEKIGNLSRDARLLFIGLVTMADDEGRLRAMPHAILGHVFPYDIDAPKKLQKWLDEIVASGMVLAYECEGLPYLAFRHWALHQRIAKPAPSILALPPDADVIDANAVEPYDTTGNFKKSAIPERVRRAVAKRAGAIAGETVTAHCHYCKAIGSISWARLGNGKPGSWVTFSGLELDHVVPEFYGGATSEDNIVLACQSCNRRKGADPDRSRNSVTPSATDGHGTGHGTGHGNPSRVIADRIGSEGKGRPPLIPPPSGGRKRTLAAWEENTTTWARAIGVDGPSTQILKAIRQCAPWQSNDASSAVFREFAAQHFTTSLTVSAENDG